MDYQVPRNVETRFTFFPDFGMKELLICVIGGIIGLFMQFFVGLITTNFIFRALTFIIFPIIGFFVSKPFYNGMSLLTLLVQMRKFNSKPKRYYYLRRGI